MRGFQLCTEPDYVSLLTVELSVEKGSIEVQLRWLGKAVEAVLLGKIPGLRRLKREDCSRLFLFACQIVGEKVQDVIFSPRPLGLFDSAVFM